MRKFSSQKVGYKAIIMRRCPRSKKRKNLHLFGVSKADFKEMLLSWLKERRCLPREQKHSKRREHLAQRTGEASCSACWETRAGVRRVGWGVAAGISNSAGEEGGAWCGSRNGSELGVLRSPGRKRRPWGRWNNVHSTQPTRHIVGTRTGGYWCSGRPTPGCEGTSRLSHSLRNQNYTEFAFTVACGLSYMSFPFLLGSQPPKDAPAVL